MNHPAAALPQRRTEYKAAKRLTREPLQTCARSRHRLVFQMAAAYGADRHAGKNRHPGAGLARHRAFGGAHLDQHGRLQRQPGQKQILELTHGGNPLIHGPRPGLAGRIIQPQGSRFFCHNRSPARLHHSSRKLANHKDTYV